MDWNMDWNLDLSLDWIWTGTWTRTINGIWTGPGPDRMESCVYTIVQVYLIVQITPMGLIVLDYSL